MKKMRSRKSIAALALMAAMMVGLCFTPVGLQAQTANAEKKVQLMASALQARNDGNYALAKQQFEELLKLVPNDRGVQSFLADVNQKLETQQTVAAAPAAAQVAAPAKSPVPVQPLTAEKVNPEVKEQAKAYAAEVAAADKAAADKAKQDVKNAKAAAVTASKNASKTADAGEYTAARQEIAQALEKLPEGKQYDAERARLQRTLANTIYDQAYASYNEMQYAQSTGYLKEYEDAVGGADSRSNYLKKLIAIYSANPRTQNINTISPGYEAKQKQITELLTKARAQYFQGDYQGAIATYRDVELRDPDNAEAKAYQIIILRELNNSALLDHKKTRAEMIDAVNRAWQRPQVYQVEKVDVSGVATDEGMRRRLETIVFPRVSFTDMPLSKVVETLSELSTDYDPNKQGVNMLFIAPPAGTPTPSISLTLRGLSLDKVLDYVTRQANYQYELSNDAVVVKPDSEGTNIGLETRFFPISRAVVIRLTGFSGGSSGGAAAGNNPWGAAGGAAPASSGPSTTEEEVKLKEFFQRAGVPFEGVAGANMAFDGTRIIATNTPRNLERLDNILKRYTDLKQVEIEAKFLDVQEGVLQELRFDWRVTSPDGTNYFQTYNGDANNLRDIAQSRVGTNAGSQSTIISNGTTTQSIPQTIPSIPGSLNLGENTVPTFNATVGVINGYSIQSVITALDQRNGVDLMSAPKVTVLSGKRAEIVVAQQMRYPTSFGDVQSEVGTSSANGGGSAGVTITAGTPQDFEVENVGVTMEVTPTVEEDDSISLALEPKVTEFEGFVEYGGTSVAISGDTTVTVPTGFIQPIFSTRMIRTEVTIFDGATVVMGGLTREDVRTVNDRVPFLGDIPLVGRLFQSKGESSSKRNLLIFVTANLISPGGAPARQNFNKMPAGSLFQNPTVVTPAASARRTLDDTASNPAPGTKKK